ncbi:MAG: GSCFA domain-containing protein [Bacteroidota bacterium]|nr:GSCFA domain-containing protein [Bacteroidota bacterium]
MKFHLEFSIPPFSEKLNPNHSLLFMGSCFSENIGEQMRKYKFPVIVNPHGILFNPASITLALNRYIRKGEMNVSELFESHGLWHSSEHHSRFSNSDKELCLAGINQQITQAHHHLQKAEWLFITLGSAFHYREKSSGKVVGNCHKLPQNLFVKELPELSEMLLGQQSMINDLRKLNPGIKIVFTVSPVRYVRDGLVENNRSKARLIELVHTLAETNKNVFYFPAYDLVMDDLRDYRFFKEDLVHPNEQAIEYVFQKLMDCSFSEKSRQMIVALDEIIQAIGHRPANSETNAHQKFRSVNLQKCLDLQTEFPSLILQQEIAFFS